MKNAIIILLTLILSCCVSIIYIPESPKSSVNERKRKDKIYHQRDSLAHDSIKEKKLK
jgi:hypothetical protein